MSEFRMIALSEYEERVATILDEKLKKANLDPADELTDEEVARIEELTKEAQDEAKG